MQSIKNNNLIMMNSIISFRISEQDKVKLTNIIDKQQTNLSKFMRDLLGKELADYSVVKNSNQVSF